MRRAYRICTRCIMDTSDPDITFDEHGVCNHCHYVERKKHLLSPEHRAPFATLIDKIKEEGKKAEYDCLIGVSGGVDSSYVAHKVKELGLRPLAVHFDNGWDSELAVDNIHRLLSKLEIDLYTYVVHWEEFKDLQLAFLKASTPEGEIPSDHGIVSAVRRTAEKHKIKYIITGYNLRTETHLPKAWSQGHMDWRYIKSIHAQFGGVKLKTFPHLDLPRLVYYQFSQYWVHLLNYMDYVKAEAITLLEKEYGWRNYESKHYESIYARFYLGYVLPKKFGFDIRRTHYSSLVCSGQMKRDDALKAMEKEPYDPLLQKEDRAYVIKKLGITDADFEAIMRSPPKTFDDYPSYHKMVNTLRLNTVAKHVYHGIHRIRDIANFLGGYHRHKIGDMKVE